MIQIGRYQLDEEEMVLIGDGQRVLLEPKVFEVLTYFCQNHNRYISMTELHETIWQGRCVSDAAVRRIISKIRLLVNDDHKNPTYIQSLPKRGYKLICAIEYDVSLTENLADSGLVEPTENLKTSLSEMSEQPQQIETSENSQPVLQDENNEQTIRVDKISLWMKALLVMLLVALVIVLGLFTRSWLFPATIETQIVNTLPGDKIAVTQSADGSYLAFSGQVHEESGFQIYVKHQSDFDFKPITQQAHLPGALAFSADNQFLYFSDSTQNASFLYRINIQNGGSEAEIIAQNYYLISDVFSARVNGDVFFAAKETAASPFLIYQYDAVNQITSTITSSSQAESLDIKGDISFDGTKLAVLRTNRLSHSDEIRVIDLKSKEVITRKHQRTGVFDISWLNNEDLLILTSELLIQMQSETGKVMQQLTVESELGSLDSTANTVLSINLGKKEKIFIEKRLPFESLNTERILQKNIYQFSYFGSEFLVLLKEGGVTQLGFMSSQFDLFKSILATEYDLTILDVSPNEDWILVKMNKRVAVFNPATVELKYITTGDDFIGDAAFSHDYKSVLFTTKNHELWGASVFELANDSISHLISDARFVRSYGENYIIGTSTGELFYLDSGLQKKISLNQTLSKEPNTRWLVRGNFIYWSTHDLVNTTFNQLNISEINNPSLEVKQYTYNLVEPDFTIDRENEKFIISQKKNTTSEIFSIIIN